VQRMKSINETRSRAYAIDAVMNKLFREIDEHWKSQPFYVKLMMENLQYEMQVLIKTCRE